MIKEANVRFYLLLLYDINILFLRNRIFGVKTEEFLPYIREVKLWASFHKVTKFC